jgi:hypothetical protein
MSALSLTMPAAVIIDKAPDQGPWWVPLGGNFQPSYVYADSFVFTGAIGTLAENLGVYMLSQDGMGPLFRFELLADDSNAPDPYSVLAVTGYRQFDDSELHLVTGGLLVPYALTNGARYWVAASIVGEDPDDIAYQVGGHTQNSIYHDNGTFRFSSDPAGIVFSTDATHFLPEMAIYVGNRAPSGIPEPATYACVLAGLGVLALLRRRARQG